MPKRRWSVSLGSRGSYFVVFEDPVSRMMQIEFTDESKKSGYSQRSLGHRERPIALQQAKEIYAKILAGESALLDPTPTVEKVVGLYLQHKTPEKSRSEQHADRRRAAMWARVLGPKKDLSKLIHREWKAFIEARRTGAITPSGEPVPASRRKPVRDGTVAGDLIFLKTVLNWATRWQDRQARYLMRENPARGFEMPVERNPRRPVADAARLARVRAVADQVTMQVGRGKAAKMVPSHLPALLDLVAGTGRRISAVLALRREDLLLEAGPHAPHGSIRWPAETDKMGKEWTVPISVDVRRAIDRVLVERPLIGQAYLFPSPTTAKKPVSKELASDWLLKAERLAGLEKQKGSLWHAYRRGWATARKHLPDVDVAAAGGWSDLTSLKKCYQHADEATMLRVVSAR